MISFRNRKASATSALIISIVTSLLPITSFSAQKISAGAPCNKLNTKAIANNKTYTCIKKGSKLVWNSGVAIKSAKASPKPSINPSSTPAPSPTASPAQTSSIYNLLKRDSRITASSILSPASICKTVDLTLDDQGTLPRNGFPRPKEALYPSNKVKILVIPFTYGSWPFSTTLPKITNRIFSDLDLLKNINKEVEKLFKEISNGSFEVEFSILPENEWWVLDPSQTFSSTPMTDNFGPIKELIKKNDGKIDFEKYDSYVFVSSLDAQVSGVAQAAFSTDVKTSKGKANKLVLMTSWANPPIYFHELGHSLFGLEDLYLQYESPAEWLPDELKVIMSWDLMANSGLSSLTNWNRLLMGWLSDSEIRCLTNQEQTTHYLSYFTGLNEPKLLLINLAPGVTLAAESRIAGTNQGLLLYVIDTNIGHGGGPLRSLNTLIKAGESKELFDWKFNVLETNKEGILFEVSKGTGKKYVLPPQRQNSGGSGNQPKPQTGEVVPISYLKARATWEVTNYQSYRIFLTSADDPSKRLFDTGVLNDSKTPLVVEITGLICGKDFITTSQFWTERDGKGVFLEVSSPQLRQWQCK